mgnify:CR=1 FL=1
MVKYEDIDPNEIKEGLLLDDGQVRYLVSCLNRSAQLLSSLRDSLAQSITADPQNKALDQTEKFIKKLHSDLKYCVTILRKEK